MDSIRINDLEVWTRIGVPDEERQAEQRLLVSVEVCVDTRAAAKEDDVRQSINYVDVTEDIRALAATERKTIERLAEDIAQMILRNDRAESVSVTVKKFAIPGTTHVSVSIRRP